MKHGQAGPGLARRGGARGLWPTLIIQQTKGKTEMRKYEIVLTGKTPLLMHNDNVEWSDNMDEWRLNPENKKMSKAGDDRTPPWLWLGYCYHDGEYLCVPQANIMRCLMEAGAMLTVPGKGKKTFKAQTQSGMMSIDSNWPLFVFGKPILFKEFYEMAKTEKFTDQKESIQNYGASLFVKRAVIKTSKHVRVRPKFDNWVLKGSIAVWDEQIDEDTLRTIFQFAGQYKGLCDWRPGGKTPGPYGMFDAEVITEK